jgi:hypothetical protein
MKSGQVKVNLVMKALLFFNGISTHLEFIRQITLIERIEPDKFETFR